MTRSLFSCTVYAPFSLPPDPLAPILHPIALFFNTLGPWYWTKRTGRGVAVGWAAESPSRTTFSTS